MKMKKICLRIKAVIMVMVMLLLPINIISLPADNIYASSIVKITKSSQVIMGSKAQISIPKKARGYKITSSNTKVAKINSKGQLTTLRLGVTKITLKNAGKKKVYTITVVPQNNDDVWLQQSLFLKDQSVNLKLVSKKYNTSQVSLKVTGSNIFSKDGVCSSYPNAEDNFTISYGSWSKKVHVTNVDPEKILEGIKAPDGNIVYAEKPVSYDGKIGDYTLSELQKGGLKILIDQKPLRTQMCYKSGTHCLKIVGGNYTMIYNYNIGYSIFENLQNHTTKGFNTDCAEVLNAVYRILDQIITTDMTDEQKVKAIHDYLIYHADYYSGDLNHRPGWSSAIKGVIMEHEGVCNSYALAFYTMATAEGIPCRVISGTATNSIGSAGLHAWNQVQLDGKWYYIDCTWDDPTGGGHERTTYYLNENLWTNHIEETSEDLVDNDVWHWENCYLTGEKWNK